MKHEPSEAEWAEFDALYTKATDAFGDADPAMVLKVLEIMAAQVLRMVKPEHTEQVMDEFCEALRQHVRHDLSA